MDTQMGRGRGQLVDSKFGMPTPPGQSPCFSSSLAFRAELRMEKPYVLLADAKILDYFLIFPLGLIPD